MPDFIKFETHAGNAVQVGTYQITPFVQTLRIEIPGMLGGLIWNRPVSVLARSASGQEQVLPVQDITRQVQLALLFASLGFTLIAGLMIGMIRAIQNRR